jgi:hypothetical protein
MMNFKRAGRKLSWPGSIYYPGIRLVGPRKTVKTRARIVSALAKIVAWYLTITS